MRAGGRERGAPPGAEAWPLVCVLRGAPGGAVRGQDPPEVNFATCFKFRMGLLKTTHRSRTFLVTLAVLACLVAAASAQRRFFYGWDESVRNIPYDGRFTFVRVRYTPAPGGNWAGGRPSWVHGYPLAEQNLMRIMKELTLLDAHGDDMNVVTLDDPELFKYPLAYIIEVGWWTLTDREAAALRLYLQKGGFLIVDDFKRPGDFGSPGWEPFEENMRRGLPDVRFFEMQPTHPIFH